MQIGGRRARSRLIEQRPEQDPRQRLGVLLGIAHVEVGMTVGVSVCFAAIEALGRLAIVLGGGGVDGLQLATATRLVGIVRVVLHQHQHGRRGPALDRHHRVGARRWERRQFREHLTRLQQQLIASRERGIRQRFVGGGALGLLGVDLSAADTRAKLAFAAATVVGVHAANRTRLARINDRLNLEARKV